MRPYDKEVWKTHRTCTRLDALEARMQAVEDSLSHHVPQPQGRPHTAAVLPWVRTQADRYFGVSPLPLLGWPGILVVALFVGLGCYVAFA